MAELRHLFPANTANPEQYIYASKFGRGEFAVPPRDRHLHASRLIQEVRTAEQQAQSEATGRLAATRPKGITLDFRSDSGFKLQLESLEVRRSGIELVNSRVVDQVMHATVFIPEGKTGIFVRKFRGCRKRTLPEVSQGTGRSPRVSRKSDLEHLSHFGQMLVSFRRNERHAYGGKSGSVVRLP